MLDALNKRSKLDDTAINVEAIRILRYRPLGMDWLKKLQLKGYVLLLAALGLTVFSPRSVRAQYLNPDKPITQFLHEAWDADHGLPQGSINAIAQTPDGYLWLGTQEGLVRFDGLDFTVFDTKNVEAFQSNDIRILQMDSAGSLWIGTRNAGLVRYRNGTFATIANQDSLKGRRITAIVESKQGHFWIGTAEAGLKQLKKGKLSHVDDVKAQNITALYEMEDGVLWVGTRDAGLVKYSSGEVEVFDTSSGLPDNAVTSFASSQHGGLWVGLREAGLVHYHGGLFFSVSTIHGLPSNKVLSLFEDGIGSLWVGTNQSGIARLTLDYASMEDTSGNQEAKTKKDLIASLHARFYEQMAISSFNSSQGLSYDVAKVFFQDREGNLWIGTDGGGVNMLREGKFTTYSTSEGLVDEFVYSVHEDLYGAMWFSTEKGVSRLKDGKVTSFNTASGLASDFVLAIESTPDSSVWMGTYGQGLSRYQNGTFKQYTQDDGLPDNAIFGLYHSSNGNLWVGTGGGATVFDGRRFIPYTEAEGLSSNYVTVMMEGSDGTMWIGTYNAGLNKIVNGKITKITTTDGLSNDAVLTLHEDSEGVVWAGTYGGGLNRIVGDSIAVYTTKDGLFSDNVGQILEDDNNNLWMSCNQGVFRVSKRELEAHAAGNLKKINSIVYDQSDGLRSREFNGGVQPAGWKSRDGSLWFPSSKGVATIDPNNILPNPFAPQMILEQVLIDGHEAPLDGQIEFPPGEKKIEFHYAGLSFISPQKITYQFMLEGVDEAWVDAGRRRAAYYTNLEPGAYTFRVKAKNSDGLESREAVSYQFYLKPFFYQTAWFYFATMFFVLVSIYLIYKWRVAKIKANEQILEKLVDQRTMKLEERTADLLQALEENKEILGITSHDLKNPLSGIIGLADILIEDLEALQNTPALDDGLENVRLLKTEAERMLRIVMELLDRHRAGELSGQTKETINLGDLISDSIRRNQPAADQKEITLHFASKNVVLVDGDEDAFLRIADNLISNAIKYSPSESNVWVSLETMGMQARMCVQDQGPGLTQEDKEKVFGKMQRLSAQPTAGEHSTGLGLFIVKQLTEELGGTVGVDSEYGAGATFWVQLPVLNAYEMA